MKTELKASQSSFDISQDKDTAKITGYASTFGNVDNSGDIVLKGAFAQTIKDWKKKGKTPPILSQHDRYDPIGKIDTMKEDDKGLYFEGTILNSIESGAETSALIAAGILDSLSIGYTVKDYEFDMKKNVRNLKALNLMEISVVTFPCNEEAAITGLKSASIATIREFEEFLRDAGYSRAQATALASHGFKGLEIQRDAGDSEFTKALEKFTSTLRR